MTPTLHHGSTTLYETGLSIPDGWREALLAIHHRSCASRPGEMEMPVKNVFVIEGFVGEHDDAHIVSPDHVSLGVILIADNNAELLTRDLDKPVRLKPGTAFRIDPLQMHEVIGGEGAFSFLAIDVHQDEACIESFLEAVREKLELPFADYVPFPEPATRPHSLS